MENREEEERVIVEEEGIREIWVSRVFKMGYPQPDQILGRSPGRPGLTESNLGYRRSTGFRLNFFLNTRLL